MGQTADRDQQNIIGVSQAIRSGNILLAQDILGRNIEPSDIALAHGSPNLPPVLGELNANGEHVKSFYPFQSNELQKYIEQLKDYKIKYHIATGDNMIYVSTGREDYTNINPSPTVVRQIIRDRGVTPLSSAIASATSSKPYNVDRAIELLDEYGITKSRKSGLRPLPKAVLLEIAQTLGLSNIDAGMKKEQIVPPWE